ncbi:protein ENHANCED DISEASE RESISTANCE 4-like isoform X2 [Mangifera indica]|uniref:protein ENHANCED DISEASE RESISTANCE 4-like isoform X2 n=1 Tax=Mangifera indica TaxID=29780 RepID=UPI001CF98BB6|nr:protein ENHANCED DISEASE RESISTANCE 4-like isoform X2 [Mangifera indica]
MTESSKVRLVRCPKCENLLPELEDYSVYQCGGCGAVLRAKVKNRETDTLSEKSEEEKIGEASTKSPTSSEKGIADSSEASDTDKADSGSLRCDQGVSQKNEVELADRFTNQSKVTNDNTGVERGLDVNTRKDETDNAIGIQNRNLNSRIGYTGGSQRSGQMSDWQTGERSEAEGSHKTMRTDAGGVRFLTSNYPEEGPSSYHSNSSYCYREPLRNRTGLDGANRVQYLEQDRVELLRKLDELKEQVSRSCDVAEKPKEKVPVDGRIVPPDPFGGSDSWLPNGSLGSDQSSMPFSGPDKHVAGPSYFNHGPDPFPYTNGHKMPLHGLHPSIHNPNHVPGYGDPFESQVLRRVSNQLPSQYQQPPSHPYFSGQYVDTTHYPFESYQQNAIFHQPSYSCYHCYDKHQQVSAPVQSTAFGNKPNNSMLYHHEIPGAFGPCVHNFGVAVPPSNFHGPQSHTRQPSDLNSKMGGFVHCYPRRVVLASGGRHCRPIAGGAPFFICNNCFELLQLPKKAKLMAKNRQKLLCGTCSLIINFEVINKKLVLSAQAETKQIATEVDNSSVEAVKEYISHSHGHFDRSGANFSSDDYDNSGYDFEAMDREPVPLPTDQVLNLGKPLEMQSLHYSSPSTCEDETSPEVLIAQKEVTKSTQQPTKATLSPPPAGSPLQEHFDYSSNNHAVNRFGKGNRSSRSDQEKLIPNRVATRQNSLKEASLATEMEVPLNEYSNTVMSQDSGDVIREDDIPRTNKGSESFFANIFKKSFKTDDHGKSNVSVNGHVIPDRVVKKAEKSAGPIRPGQYWYDFRGGFWGVLGGPCLGIILKTALVEILEFSSMEENFTKKIWICLLVEDFQLRGIGLTSLRFLGKLWMRTLEKS